MCLWKHRSGMELVTERNYVTAVRCAAIGSRNFTNQCHAGEPENWSQRSWNYSPILLHPRSYGAWNACPSVTRLVFSAAAQIACRYYVTLLLYTRSVSNEIYKSTALGVVFVCNDNNVDTHTHTHPHTHTYTHTHTHTHTCQIKSKGDNYKAKNFKIGSFSRKNQQDKTL